MSKQAALLLALALIIGTGAGVAIMGRTRGIRNNNPGNIRKSGVVWRGMAPPAEQTDSAFIVFSAPEWGIRALAKILVNYQDLHGINTVRGIINRYAPPSENNTAAYVDAVARRVGASPDAPLDIRRVLPELIAAIIKHENGVQPYSAATITRGINLAGVAV